MELGQMIVFLFLPMAILKTESFSPKQVLESRMALG